MKTKIWRVKNMQVIAKAQYNRKFIALNTCIRKEYIK